MLKEMLLKEFAILNCVKDYTALEKYVDFCITKNVQEKIPQKTSSHHILPRAKSLPFSQYSNFKEHPWNKTELYYGDHYYAHYLLTLALDHYAVIFSFSCMHKKDFKYGRISENDLIDKEEFSKLWSQRNKQQREYLLEKIVIDGIIMSRASYFNRNTVLTDAGRQKLSAKVSGNNNIVHLEGVVEKIRKTKASTFIDGKNMDTISAERAAQTMHQIFLTETGEETTIYKQSAKKHSKTINTTFINENGEETTIAKEGAKVRAIILRNRGKWYILKNIFDNTFEKRLCAVEVRKISPGLEKCGKDNYLGKSKFGQNYFTKRGTSNLIGLYVEKL